jgi:hypothetical protein
MLVRATRNPKGKPKTSASAAARLEQADHVRPGDAASHDDHRQQPEHKQRDERATN